MPDFKAIFDVLKELKPRLTLICLDSITAKPKLPVSPLIKSLFSNFVDFDRLSKISCDWDLIKHKQYKEPSVTTGSHLKIISFLSRYFPSCSIQPEFILHRIICWSLSVLMKIGSKGCFTMFVIEALCPPAFDWDLKFRWIYDKRKHYFNNVACWSKFILNFYAGII